jgi:pSer/pThr/pTyr-binding forkhead associated (FHA) protein
MPVLKLNDQQYVLHPGETRVGGGSNVDLNVADESYGLQAILEVGGDGKAIVRRGNNNASVRVNGHALGVEPTPLIHGDKVEIGGHELLFADDAKAGSTTFVSAKDFAQYAQKRSGAARATAATGGRLVSLVDGKEYPIPGPGVTIGRDAACDVVVAETEVSRKHAEVTVSDAGYMLVDRSTNGVFVNGTKIAGSQLLSRADVIRIGTEEFRFYADVARTSAPTPGAVGVIFEPPAPPPPLAAPSVPVAPLPIAAAPPAPPPAPPAPRVVPQPTAPAPSAPIAASADASSMSQRPLLATLEVVNSGPTKGIKHEIRSPLATIGRGPFNDVVIADESVSDTHAKLQRRDGGWFVLDMGSTNGTYVGGTRIAEERRLEGAPDVRFGGVKMIFRATERAPAEVTGTRAIAPIGRPTSSTAPQSTPSGSTAPRERVTAAPPPAATESATRIPVWVWAVVALAVIGVVVYFLLNR